jgi:hypothetical protein
LKEKLVTFATNQYAQRIMKGWPASVFVLLLLGLPGSEAKAKPAAGGDPDLIISKVIARHRVSDTVYAVVRNAGDAQAGPCHLKLTFYNFNAMPDKIFTTTVPAIAAHHNAWVKVSADTPFVTLDQQNHVRAMRPFFLTVDSNFEVSELDEENNVAYFAPPVSGAGSASIKIPGKQ